MAAVDAAWRNHSRSVLATLVRLLRDFDLAEEALHDAFLAAARRWPAEGMPQNPVAWLVSVGRFSSIDRMRRKARFAAAHHDITLRLYPETEVMPHEELILADDQLRMIFVCCHPLLPKEAQIALTLREVCGLTTEEIGRAFLTSTPTIAQRIVRAKARLKQAGLPYEVPSREELPARLDAVLRVIYLLFNEGYSAHAGLAHIRSDLCAQAIRLGRLLLEMLPDADVLGLLGMMLLHESRRQSRQDKAGDIVLLAGQDRSTWDRELIDEGHVLIERAFEMGEVGAYTIQGAIAAVHARAESTEATNWHEIVGLYDLMLQTEPSPVVRLNRSVAIFKAQGIDAGLSELENVMHDGELDEYGPAHSVAAEFYLAAGRREDARRAFVRALERCQQEPERRLLQRRLNEISA
ncbi:RNA polymerase sigma factor [Devosia sp. XK-2]|uniref:RNA polymerase sigma factor n=1 Tax=Devosia sp. XK-2 TaxID=3126689 RepID=UPI0030D3EAF5